MFAVKDTHPKAALFVGDTDDIVDVDCMSNHRGSSKPRMASLL